MEWIVQAVRDVSPLLAVIVAMLLAGIKYLHKEMLLVRKENKELQEYIRLTTENMLSTFKDMPRALDRIQYELNRRRVGGGTDGNSGSESE